ncbi:MAG: hypothetical protein AAB577_02665 [Patescibacteria group bacterium]
MPDARKNMTDRRLFFWMDFEDEIQKRAPKKDPNFDLNGPGNKRWKKFIREEDGFKIFAVSGETVRNNVDVTFGHGGHGLVHVCIPLDEIWIDMRHYFCLDGCDCDNLKRKNQPVSKEFFESTTIHETTEFLEMKNGRRFNESDPIARQAERGAGLLVDPTTEIDWPYPVLKEVGGKMIWVA